MGYVHSRLLGYLCSSRAVEVRVRDSGVYLALAELLMYIAFTVNSQ